MLGVILYQKILVDDNLTKKVLVDDGLAGALEVFTRR